MLVFEKNQLCINNDPLLCMGPQHTTLSLIILALSVVIYTLLKVFEPNKRGFPQHWANGLMFYNIISQNETAYLKYHPYSLENIY